MYFYPKACLFLSKSFPIFSPILQLAALGGFILLFGFLAFNGSSQGAISSPGDGTVVATAVKNTVLGGTGGAFITLTLNRIKWFGNSTWSFLTTLNGCLAGMVSYHIRSQAVTEEPEPPCMLKRFGYSY